MWYWEATFQSPSGEMYEVKSLRGFKTEEGAIRDLEKAIKDGRICVNGVPEGSELVDATSVLENKNC